MSDDTRAARTIHSVAQALARENVGLAVWSSRVEFPTATQAAEAVRQFEDARIGAAHATGSTRVGIVYDELRANVVARIIMVCDGTLLPRVV